MADLYYKRKPLYYVFDLFESGAGAAGAAAAGAAGGGLDGPGGDAADGAAGDGTDAGGGADSDDGSPGGLIVARINSTLVPCASFEGSLRGGTYQLCGRPEFIPSSPPRYYRRLDDIGDNTSQRFTDAGCTIPNVPPQVTCTHNGSIQYNPATCVPITTGGFTCTDGASGGVNTSLGATDCFKTLVTTRTSQSGTPNGMCCPDGMGAFEKQTAYGEALTLTDEDTEADAIARLIAGSPWSAYGAGTQPLARWQVNRAGASGVYVEARFQGTAVVPQGLTRFVMVALYRRLFGVGPYIQIGIVYFPMVGGPGDVGTFSGTVPNIAGYETYAQCLTPF